MANRKAPLMEVLLEIRNSFPKAFLWQDQESTREINIPINEVILKLEEDFLRPDTPKEKLESLKGNHYYAVYIDDKTKFEEYWEGNILVFNDDKADPMLYFHRGERWK